MKAQIMTFILGCLISVTIAFPQVGMNTDATAPDPSAMLDVKSSTKGMLVPRMTASERNNIFQPATGLLIFCTTDNRYYSNTGTPASPNWTVMNTQWVSNGPNIYFDGGNVGIGWHTPHAPLQLSNILANRKIVLYELDNNDNQYYGFGINDHTLRYQVNTTIDRHVFFAGNGPSSSVELMRIQGNGTVAIGTSSPASSAVLDVSSSSKGFLPPGMTSSQRNAISSPANGLLVFQTDAPEGYYIFYNSKWTPLVGSEDRYSGNVLDCEGHVYPIVQIGSQLWMAKNLRVTHYSNGTPIPFKDLQYADCSGWTNNLSGMYSTPFNDPLMQERFDSVMWYNWYAVNQPAGLCPVGWHVPSDAEWTTLVTYLDSIDTLSWGAGGLMKTTIYWNTYGLVEACNASGFSALPAGGLHYDCGGIPNYTTGIWWSSTQTNSDSAWYRKVTGLGGFVTRGSIDKNEGYTVRCLKD